MVAGRLSGSNLKCGIYIYIFFCVSVPNKKELIMMSEMSLCCRPMMLEMFFNTKMKMEQNEIPLP